MRFLDHPTAALGLVLPVALAIGLSVASCLDSVTFRPGKTADGTPNASLCVTVASASAASAVASATPSAGAVQ